jgi:pimeloyl-ACP methyl ester carboxylesterase
MLDRRSLLQTSAASMAALALPAPAHADERFASGDVTIFYRRFGKPGKTPLVLMHGANYFDSFDWINVAQKLATDREVVCFDMRGFGESSWSPSKNYSVDALMGDIRALSAHLGWRKPIVAGHSFSGRLAVSFASNFPDELSRLIVIDSAFGEYEPSAKGINNPPVIFPTVEAAMERFGKLANPPRISQDRARAEQALTKVAAGYQLKRDPDYSNANPTDPSVKVRRVRELDVWEELPKVKAPMYFLRGLKSNRFTPPIVARLNKDFPQIVWATADSMHDIPFYAPDELIAALRSFMQDV